jgi:hypothetical protein
MNRNKLVTALPIIVLALASSASPAIIFQASGVSAKNVPVSFTAGLSIEGDILTIVLTNTSPVDTRNPDDTLGSFYFDILNAYGVRPVLTYLSATGDVYLCSKKNPDVLQEARADILADSLGEDSWMFAMMSTAANPYLRFGIGTVGNGNMTPNNFNGNIVDGVNYSIYKGEITTQNLNNVLLVKETATFTFSGLTGFTEGDIVQQVAFGLGTGPDSMMVATPEPAMLAILGLGGLLLRRRIG